MTTKQAEKEVTRRQRLIDLAVWVAGEAAKKRLGLPSEWYQGQWLSKTSCGTTCCIAGKVALDEGAQPLYGDDGYSSTGRVVLSDGRRVYVEDYAQDLLGLDDDERDNLFRGANDLDDILDAIQDLLS